MTDSVTAGLFNTVLKPSMAPRSVSCGWRVAGR